MEPMPPPAPPSPPALPQLSTTVLLAMAGIAAVVLAAIFGYILFISNLRIDERLWYTGLASMIFAFGFFLLYGATHDRKVARPIAERSSSSGRELLRLHLLGQFGRLGEAPVPYPSVRPRHDRPRGDLRHGRDAERDAIRKAQRKHIP